MNEVVDCFRKILCEKDVSVAQLQVSVVFLERYALIFLIKLFAEFKWDNLRKVIRLNVLKMDISHVNRFRYKIIDTQLTVKVVFVKE
jgi:hypothetical protein